MSLQMRLPTSFLRTVWQPIRCISSTSASGYGGSKTSSSPSSNKDQDKGYGVEKIHPIDEVIVEEIGNKGVITLNRPKALNALTLPMIRAIHPALQKWDKSDRTMIYVKGAGGKAFCAGGDVRAVVESARGGSSLKSDFFREEFRLNYLISKLTTPYVALIDGIVMGGGVGLSVHGMHRIATERTLFAMPETAIGFIPDVGGTYVLPRLKGKLGLFLGLTGYRLKGLDVYHAGIANHILGSQNLLYFNQELLSLKPNPQTLDLERSLGAYTKDIVNQGPPFSLEPQMDLINHCFGASSVEEIVNELAKDGSSFAKQTLELLRKMSPTSLKLTLKALEEGKQKSLKECLEMEYRLSQRIVVGHDMYEGVRALLIDKDPNAKWKPSKLEDVHEDLINSYFEPLPPNQELVLE